MAISFSKRRNPETPMPVQGLHQLMARMPEQGHRGVSTALTGLAGAYERTLDATGRISADRM